jgi:hypothetical protein
VRDVELPSVAAAIDVDVVNDVEDEVVEIFFSELSEKSGKSPVAVYS